MRVKIVAKLANLSSDGPTDVVNTSSQTPSISTVKTGKNLGDLKNLSQKWQS